MVCERCTAARCSDDVVWLECEACGGRSDACPTCGGRGRVRIEGCVRKQIRPETWDLLEMCHFTDGGTWPVSGGVLDQTAAYLRAYRWVRSEKAALLEEITERK